MANLLTAIARYARAYVLASITEGNLSAHHTRRQVVHVYHLLETDRQVGSLAGRAYLLISAEISKHQW
jgi:hypothetical protein